jgi:shikimate dehydrogenase
VAEQRRTERNGSQVDRYALVGHPVDHSRSPLIHELFARQTRQRLDYELIDAEAASFETAVRAFGDAGGRGLNVTVPHKEAAFELAEELGAEASIAGAVNTLTFTGGRLRGDNTDGTGFLRDLTTNQRQRVMGSRTLILGAGGAARGIVAPLLGAGTRELVLANRTVQRAEQLREHFREHFREQGEIGVCTFDELASAEPFELVVNATSAGLRGEEPPFPPRVAAAAKLCYDLVYSVNDTPFVAWAKRHGAARAVQGWGMLVEQAAESFYLWRGIRPDTAPILKQLVR